MCKRCVLNEFLPCFFHVSQFKTVLYMHLDEYAYLIVWIYLACMWAVSQDLAHKTNLLLQLIWLNTTFCYLSMWLSVIPVSSFLQGWRQPEESTLIGLIPWTARAMRHTSPAANWAIASAQLVGTQHVRMGCLPWWAATLVVLLPRAATAVSEKLSNPR